MATHTPQVIYEDNHLLILHKPPGWLVQGDKTGDATLTDWGRAYIKKRYSKPGEAFLHPCHRLDRPVSGLTVFARTSKALERMNQLFRQDEVQKTYLAVVQGHPESPTGHLVHWLRKDPQRNLVTAYPAERPGAKRAELTYETLACRQGLTLLRIHPKTGRPHQIRVQLATLGCPIMGDLKYGFSTPNPDKSIHLHAFQVSFVHPVKKEAMTLSSPPGWAEFKTHIP